MKVIKVFLILVVVALIFAGCASAPEEEPVKEPSELPDFVLNPPIATDAIYGVGYGKQSNAALSLKVAETNARVDIANQVETTVQAAVTSYAQEAGEGDNTQVIQFAESIARQITDFKLKGAVTVRREQVADGGWWVMIMYPKDAFKDDFDAVANDFIRNEAAAFAEFKADQALQALDHQLENNPTVSTPTGK
jgi:hypothetical protein